ncbi:MAG: hypothetical protein R3C14_14330 [Caldilineaceae bacterium]
MASEVFVEEPVDVLTRVLGDGTILPTSFLWRQHTRYVNHVGRRWEERVQGRTMRYYLVQTVDGNTYELCFDPGRDRWTVQRAWLRDWVV